jgi:hypothetical protein
MTVYDDFQAVQYALQHAVSGGRIVAAVDVEPLRRLLRSLSFYIDDNCPGHVASVGDPKLCGRCGVHVDSFRPDDDDGFNPQGSGPAPIEPREG